MATPRAGEPVRPGAAPFPPRRWVYTHGYAFDAVFDPGPGPGAAGTVWPGGGRGGRRPALVRVSAAFGPLPLPFIGVAVRLGAGPGPGWSEGAIGERARAGEADLLLISSFPRWWLNAAPLVTWRPLRATYSSLSSYRVGGVRVRFGGTFSVAGRLGPGLAISGDGLAARFAPLAHRLTLRLLVAEAGRPWSAFGTVTFTGLRPNGDVVRFSPVTPVGGATPVGRLAQLRANVYGRAQGA